MLAGYFVLFMLGFGCLPEDARARDVVCCQIGCLSRASSNLHMWHADVLPWQNVSDLI